MPIQALNAQNDNPYLATMTANTETGRNQTPARQTQTTTAREDVVTLSPAGQQRQNKMQTAATQNNGATGGTNTTTGTQQANTTTQTPAGGLNTAPQTPAPAENARPMTRPANEVITQQQQSAANENNGMVTGLNVIV